MKYWFMLFCVLAINNLNAGNAVTSGAFTVDPPTLICLGFHWQIDGDDNRNASAEVEFRKMGTKEWLSAQPLMRIGGFHVGRSYDWLDHLVPNGLAGSIFGLEEDTEYEVRITLKDPDGIEGVANQEIKVRTRSEPKMVSGGNIYHLFPKGKKGLNWTKNEFENLYHAYYGGVGNLGDFNMVWERIIQPGDTIIVHAGVYKANLNYYVDKMGLVPDGTYWLTAKGTKEKPITIKAAGDGEVVFDGSGAEVLFNMQAADWHVIEGITFRNCGYAIFAGQQRVGGCVGLTVRNCRFENVRDGIFSLWNGAKDFYLADNIFLGRNERDRMTGWGKPEDGYLKSNTAITLQGSGHVVCRNAIAYFWQAYHMGTAFQGYEQGGVSCDIYDNDLYMLIDDGFEVDGCTRNVRVFNNRIVEVGSPISVQPVYGGPVYFIRNVAYGLGRAGLKIHEAWPSGMVFLHNTIIANMTVSRGTYTVARFMNNLFLGAGEKGAMAFPSPGHDVISDYNGYNPMTFRTTKIDGKKPIMDKTQNPYWPLKSYPEKKDDTNYKDFAEFQRATGHESHGQLVDYGVFESLKAPSPRTKKNPTPPCHSGNVSFELNPQGRAVDKGLRLANINEGFSGNDPDLGAIELGLPTPHYGPSWVQGDFDFAKAYTESVEVELEP